MTDPFDALRAPAEPVAPDPAFAAALRARIERALTLPRGVAVSTSTVETTTAPLGAAVPYLTIPAGAGRRALEWYADVLDARPVGEPITMPDGKLGHAELAVGAGRLYLAEELPGIGVTAPRPDEASVSLSLQVPDVAETMRRAIDGGARMPRPTHDDHGSRNVTIVDPFGHRWLLHTPLAELPDRQRPGDVGYAWLTVPDPDRAAAFYAAVLGWDYTPGSVPGGRNVTGRALPLGIGGGEPGWHLSYAVADVAAAVERVRAAGGTASAPESRAYGSAADCTDADGTVFALHEAGGPRSPANGAGPGDLSYLTFEAIDSARFRGFYGEVLGWTYAAGRVDDGWTVERVSPMTGMHGGHDAAAAVPMWKVEDVAAAVERVRAAGGTATEPERMPFGMSAECTDDQGIRFYLGDA